MADNDEDQQQVSQRKRRPRPTKNAVGQGDQKNQQSADANQLFQILINANMQQDQGTQSVMWVPEEEEGYVIATVVSKNKDSVEVEMENGQVCKRIILK